ncbi:gastrin-releasing peptide receptor-like [Glandiceps talaboti]
MAELDPDVYPDNGDFWITSKLDKENEPNAKTVSIVLLYIVILLIGGTGNVLTVLVVSINSHMRTVTNLFISQMAVADLTLLLLAMPFDIISVYVYQRWTFSACFCKAMLFFQDYAIAVTIFTLVAMSIDRFLTLSRPMRAYSIRSVKKFIAVTVIVQLLAISAAIPKAISGDVIEQPYVPPTGNGTFIPICWINLKTSDWLKLALSRVVVFYVTPLLIITVAFTKINSFLRSNEAQVLLSSNYKIMAACKRALKLLLTLITLYSVLLLPATIDSIVSVFVHVGYMSHDKWYSLCKFLAGTCLYSVCVYKPFIYSMMSANYRRGFRNLICCLKHNPDKEGVVSQGEDSSTVETNSVWSYYSGTESVDADNVGERL